MLLTILQKIASYYNHLGLLQTMTSPWRDMHLYLWKQYTAMVRVTLVPPLSKLLMDANDINNILHALFSLKYWYEFLTWLRIRIKF